MALRWAEWGDDTNMKPRWGDDSVSKIEKMMISKEANYECI